MPLRPYQADAVAAIYAHLREREDNPCVVLPTAAGKTHVIAQVCRDAVQLWQGKVLIVSHVKELLEQSVQKLRDVASDLPIGVYSAGLRQRDTGYAVTVAGIQSIYQKAPLVGAVDLVLVDEAHLIPPEGDGMYRTFLADMRRINPDVRIIGFTATPFRMKSGLICDADNVLNSICYSIGIRELIAQGFLCPLRSKGGKQHPDYDSLHVRAGEYVTNEVEQLMDGDELVLSACHEIVDYTTDRRSVLIFCSGVQHAEHVVRTFAEVHKAECGLVTSETLPFERTSILDRFRTGALKCLANVNVLTTGFDAPNIDCVALIRPTLSPGLYYQMVGRGFRLAPGKTDCLILDFGGNILRHGPVDQIRIEDVRVGGKPGPAPAKECPQCHALIAAGYAICPDCGHVFPEPERNQHDGTASTEGVLSGEVTREELEVQDVYYCRHEKRNAPEGSLPTMRVRYQVGGNDWVSEWLCFEHEGYPRRKAELWWAARSDAPVPDTVDGAVQLAQGGALSVATAIIVERRTGERFEHIVGYTLGDQATDQPKATETQEGGCPNCGKTEQMYERTYDGKPVAFCAWCNHAFGEISEDVYSQYVAQEIPF